jgi:hypothetical protein
MKTNAEIVAATPPEVRKIVQVLMVAGAEAYRDYRYASFRFWVSLACNVVLLAVLFWK